MTVNAVLLPSPLKVVEDGSYVKVVSEHFRSPRLFLRGLRRASTTYDPIRAASATFAEVLRNSPSPEMEILAPLPISLSDSLTDRTSVSA